MLMPRRLLRTKPVGLGQVKGRGTTLIHSRVSSRGDAIAFRANKHRRSAVFEEVSMFEQHSLRSSLLSPK